jgi:uncharacterized membrane protein YeaQ/YmgE (transglycosylase-associated protein family)
MEGSTTMGILSWIVVGAIAGWLTGLVMKGGGYGLIGDIVLGIIGALVGGFLASAIFGMTNAVSGINLESIIVAVVGAIVVVAIVRLITGRRVA